MFIDEVIVTCKAGKGGDGIISWRKEKYIPKGGPYGGDGGKGGDIILRATSHETTLAKFRHLKTINAEDGERGGIKVMHGGNGKNTVLEVPVGTMVVDTEDERLICDLVKPGEEFVLCDGGRGGFGNAHFTGATRQAPNFAELGDVGEEKNIKLELKLVADIALVGLPNAGKSTLIKAITNVKPKIADYPFTTIIPNLGVMEYKGRALVIEDAPGLIEGASEGKGLGTQFLKHIERARVIVHLIDASAGEEAMIKSYTIIRNELEKWSADMAAKKEIIILTKADIVDPEMLEEMKMNMEKGIGKPIALTISAGAYIRTNDLKDLFLQAIPENLPTEQNIREDEDGMLVDEVGKMQTRMYDLKREKDPKRCTIARIDAKTFEVKGERLEEIVRMTNLKYIDGINRVYDVMERFGIIRKIKQIITTEIREDGKTGFFEGEEDITSPDVLIAGKKFSLENILFMKGSKE